MEKDQGLQCKVNMDDMSKFFEWFFITSVASVKDGVDIEEFVSNVVDNGEVDENGELNGTHRIRMFVNEIEVDPMSAIRQMQEQFDEQVLLKAKSLLDDKINGEFDDIYELLDEIKRGIDIRKERLQK